MSFLKPTKGKIILTILLGLISLFSTMLLIAGLNIFTTIDEFLEGILWALGSILFILPSHFTNINFLKYGYLGPIGVLILVIFVLYILSCLIIYIFKRK